MGKTRIFHVLIKYPHTGFKLASQHYSKASAKREARKWTDAPWFFREGHKIKIVEVKRRTMGLARFSRSGRVVGWSSPYDLTKHGVARKVSDATRHILSR